MAEERVKDALREAEQERLIRQVEGSSRARALWPPAALIVTALLVFVVLHP